MILPLTIVTAVILGICYWKFQHNRSQQNQRGEQIEAAQRERRALDRDSEACRAELGEAMATSLGDRF